ncbi:hypothetical protein RK21_02865 [Pseudomonas plecoglossicida]|nr:hypothetical protein RK21_02865 [Pseudomonas plecoglossicida]
MLRHILERLSQARSVEDYEALLQWGYQPATIMQNAPPHRRQMGLWRAFYTLPAQL